MFNVVLSPEAQAFFASADLPLARRLSRCFVQLELDPRRHNNIKRLSGNIQASTATASGIGGLYSELTMTHEQLWFSQSRTAVRFIEDSHSEDRERL